MQINDSDSGKIGFPYDAEYITDQKGHIKSVILDYTTYKKIEEILLDYGLAKAMDEAAEEDEVDLETAKKSSGYSR
jgi:hypothetical protein